MLSVLNLPPTILVEDLLKTGPGYNPDEIEDADALYHGGELFKARIDDFLVKRKIEDRNRDHYELRKKRAHYVPYTGGIIDYIGAKSLANGFRIEGGEGDPYWDSLVVDADGRGTSLKTFSITCLIHAMLFKRAYVFPDFGTAAAFGKYDLDARLAMLEPKAIDDWQCDEKENVQWVRAHTMELTRDEAKPYLPPDQETHYWTFFDSFNSYRYSATRKVNYPWPKDAKAILDETKPHGLDECPVFNIRVGENMEIFDRIKSVAVALFNREASITWALDMAAYATLVLTLDSTQVSEIVSSELAALKLRVGESASYISPAAQIFEPLFNDADRLKSNLLDVVRAQGVNAADLPQAGRLSGTAVNAMREPSDALLRSFADPVLEAINRALGAIAKKRGMKDTVRVVLDEGVKPDGEEEPVAESGVGGSSRESEAGSDDKGSRSAGSSDEDSDGSDVAT